MGTTTIRVDNETHRRLHELSKLLGHSLQDTVREATAALERQRFAAAVRLEFAELQRSPNAFTEYLAEASATELSDGIDR
jgi:predicted transcriptional regulator